MPTIDPLRGSRAHVGELLDRCDTAEALFAALTRVERSAPHLSGHGALLVARGQSA